MHHMIDFFIDPVLRGPMLGCMLMGLATALVGVVILLQKRSLLGEALSHAAYPGLAVVAFLSVGFVAKTVPLSLILLLLGAIISCVLAFIFLHFLETKMSIPSDCSLCFILSAFFGVGVLIVSYLQKGSSLWVKQIQLFLYGQPATMTDRHILLYFCLVCLVIGVFIIFFPLIKITLFDREFAKSQQIPLRSIDILLTSLLLLAIVIGMRSAGVVLLAGLLIAPPLAARQYTSRLSKMFFLSGFFGIISAFLGNYFSIVLPDLFVTAGDRHFSLPTGPMILLVGSFLCFFSLFFAPENGIFFRKMRALRFKRQRQMENVLKLLRKESNYTEKPPKVFALAYFFWLSCCMPALPYSNYYKVVAILMGTIHTRAIPTLFLARTLLRKGWVQVSDEKFTLSQEGQQQADRIIHHHKLFAVYLVEYLGQNSPAIRYAAQEMEHILTKEMEQEIMDFLHRDKEE